MDGRALRIRVAGGCSVAAVMDDVEPQPVPSRQGRLVLARLALAHGPVARDVLADLLWPDSLPLSWERHLSAVVSKLRALLGTVAQGEAAGIVGRPGTYELRLPTGSVIDVVQAEADAQRARRSLMDDRLDDAAASGLASVAVARQAFLPGTDALWVDERREALRRVLVDALEVVVEVAVRRRDPDGVAYAHEAIGVDPYREASYRQLMRLLLAVGERAAAEAVARQCRNVLSDLGLAPSAELDELRHAALAGVDPEQRSASPLRGLGWRDGHALPVPTSSFVGRDDAVAAVVAALGRSRLVTLTGTGGVGKSRLAIETAHVVAGNRRDGARLCELAHVTDPGGVVFAMAAAVGVGQLPRAPVEYSLLDALVARDVLLVVDNCEHLLDTIVPLIERVLRYCPDVQVLATSRERLAAEGELVVGVPPLEVPGENTDMATAWDQPAAALELLRDRIASVRPDLPSNDRHRYAIVDIARRLDGLPLALELAAARVAVLGPVEVAQRLDRRFGVLIQGRRTALPRHRTLWATIEWSYDLLDGRERNVFERAAVFVGGFTLDAAEHVCTHGGVHQADVAEVVAALADKSILTIDDRGPVTRYRMLETLRQFGQEQLTAHRGFADAERAHALYFTALAWQAEAGLRGPDEPKWVAVLADEAANLGVAHAWALRSGNHRVAAEISAALFGFAHWRMRTDVLSWAEPLADVEVADAGPHAIVALAAAGDAAWMRGDLARARSLGEQAVALGADATAARYGWHVLGAVALFEGRLPDAATAIGRAKDLALRDGDHHHATDMLGSLALILSYIGDTAAAIATAEASNREAALSGSPSAAAWAAYATGEALTSTRPHEALPHLQRAIELADTVAAHFIHGVALLSATALRARHGEAATAARALVDLIDHWERAGNWRQQWITLRLAVELLVRLGSDRAAATVLGAIDAADATQLYGADAERLSRLRAELATRLGATLDDCRTEGRVMQPPEVVTFTRRQLARL